MPKYSLDEDAEPRLEITGGAFGGKIAVRLDGKEIDAGKASEFAVPRTYDVGDGRTVEITWVRKRGFDVRCDGVVLRGSASHPTTAVGGAATVIYVIAVVTVVAAFLRGTLAPEELRTHSILIGLALAAIFAGLGFAVSRGSLLALWCAIVLYALDGVDALLAGSLIAAGIHVLLIIPMFKGVGAIRSARSAEERAAARRARPAGERGVPKSRARR